MSLTSRPSTYSPALFLRGVRRLIGSGPDTSEDRALSQLALQARGGPVPGVEGGGQRQPQELGPDAHHLAAEIGLRRLLANPAREDRVADERVVGDHEANTSRRVARRVKDGELELAELELVAVEQVAVGRAQELLGVGRVKRGLAAGQLLEVVLAGDVTRVAVRWRLCT